MLPPLHDVAGILEGAEIVEADGIVRGYLRGQRVTLTYKMHDQGSISVYWMEASCRVAEGLLLVGRATPTLMSLARDGFTPGKAAARSFEDAFTIEGAPERVVRELLAAPDVRAGLLSLARAGQWGPAPERLFSAVEGALVLGAAGWAREQAEALLRTTAALAALSAEIADRDRAETANYRGESAPERRLHEEREVREAKAKLVRRAASRRRREILGWSLVVVIPIAMALGESIWQRVVTGQWPSFHGLLSPRND